MKKLLALLLVVSLAACAGSDRTPDKHETAVVTHVATKVAGTPVVFVCGVVTWPLGLVGAANAAGAGEYDLMPPLLGWPFTWTYIYWVDPFDASRW